MKFILFSSIIFLISLTLPLHAQNITRPNIPGPGGLSANAFTGNLFYQRTDVLIPGKGLSLEATLSYNSAQLSEQRGAGNGWRLNYDMCYQMLPDQHVVIERMDGRRDTFTLSGADYNAPAGIFDSLAQYEPGKFKLIAKSRMAYFFEDASHKKLTKIEDRNGNMLTLSYAAGKLTAATDAAGRNITFGWIGGFLTSVTDPNFSPQRVYQYNYDNFGNLTRFTNPVGDEMTFTYNPNRQLISMMDGNGNSTVVAYTNSGAVRRMASCDSKLELTYNRARRQTYVVEQTGNTAQATTYTFDTEGNLENRQGNCCGFNVTYAYDTDKNITQRTDANGNTFNYTYDSRGNRLTDTNADGTITYTYHPVFNRITSIVDRRTNTTTFTYDATGNLTQIARPLGVTEQLSYNADGTVASYTDANGKLTQFTYDANGYLTGINYPIGAESYAYDAAGNLTSVTDANGYTATFTYDALNRPVSMADHLDNTRSFTYDSNGNLLNENDENSHLTEYGYDVLNRLNEVTTPVAAYQYDYDQVGNLTRLLDGNQHATQYSYNSQNLLAELTDAADNSTHYEYDGNGNLIARTDANGNLTTYLYDGLNRLVEKSYNDNTDSYSYDANGNLTSCANDDITINLTYDALNRLESKTYVEWGKTISYTYDDAGNRTSMTDPDGGLTTYSYDDMNRLVSIENPSQLTTTFQYDDAGRPTLQTNSNGTRTEYAYNAADQLLSAITYGTMDTILLSYVYTYDNKGNRLTMTDLNGAHVYEYDDADRLISVSYPDGQSEQFTYDPAGNRASLVRNGQPTNYTYDAADRLLIAGNISYTFDDNGNLIRKEDSVGITSYNYDGEDRLIQIVLPDNTSIQYSYDPFGNRLVKSIDNSLTQYLLENENILMELDAANNTLARYTTGFGFDSWLSMDRGGTSYTYHQDGLNSVVGLTESANELTAQYEYYAYGEMKNNYGTVNNPFGFTGREREAEAGLYYYRSRFYDQKAGRFIVKDKFKGYLDFPSSLNSYTYVEDNPVTFNDPKGFKTANTQNFRGPTNRQYPRNRGPNYRNRREYRRTNVKPTREFENLGDVPDIIKEWFEDFWRVSQDEYLPWQYINRNGEYIEEWVLRDEYERRIRERWAKDFYGEGAKDKCQLSWDWNGNLVCHFPDLENDIRDFLWPEGGSQNDNQSGDQDGPQPPPDGEASCSVGVQSRDPNAIEGPEGIGPNRWVSKNDLFKYTIYFENDPDSATAAAQLVTITQDLDPRLDPGTFRLDNFGFGSFQFEVPENSTHYQARLDVADSVGVLVDIEAGIDYDDHRLYWTFESIDTITGLFTTDPLAGFLPVNDTLTGSGEGFVSYTISARESAMTYDSILAQASIIFDDNAPLATNQEVNLVDADPPESEVLNIQSAIDSAHLLVEFTGTDVGSGLRHYNLYVRQGNGSFLKWMGPTAGPYAILPATPDSTYCVISISADSVLNLEGLPLDCIPVTFTLDLLNGCPITLDWTFGQAPIQPGTYRAAGSILSSSQVAEAGSVHFRAGQGVHLSQGFEAAPGSLFSAKIEACDPPMGARTGLSPAEGAATGREAGPLRLDPASARVRVRFDLPQAGAGSLRVVNAAGAEVARPLPHQVFAAGEHQYIVDVSGFPEGVYSLVLQVGEERAVWRVEVGQ